MKTLIICYSTHHKNTLKLAQTMAPILMADIVTPECMKNDTFSHAYDIIGFGSGIYAGRHHSSLFDVVKRMPNQPNNVFIFSTKALANVTVYHALLRSSLKKKGCTIIKEFSCRGYSTYGPLKLIGGINRGYPCDSDIHNAQEFARSILQSYT